MIKIINYLMEVFSCLFLCAMSQKRALWLCSWYPNNNEPFNGDFIQRQAMAASLYNHVNVIHVADSSSILEYASVTGNLEEHIAYFRKSTSLLKRISNNYRLLRIYRRTIKLYIAHKGKPDIVHVNIPLKAG